MAKITIKDVAREAGVSISTVSNALNNVDVLSNDTKAHVLEVAERLNYIPNLNGKFLKSGQSKMIGFFTTSMTGGYFYKLVEAMSRECDSKGYGLNILFTRDTKVIMSNILGKRIDGVIIFEESKIGEKELSLMLEQKVKAVFLDRELKAENISSVIFNSYKSGVEATKYLINLGHKKIGFISGVDTMYDNVQRKQAYKDTLTNCGLEFKAEYILQGSFEEEFSYNSMKTFIRSNFSNMPDAFLAANDLSAIGSIKALQSEGYKVPDDISVIGFDDIDISQYFHPPLTTVKNPIVRQGILAVDILLDMINKNKASKIVKLDGKLIVRSSSSIYKNS